MNAHWKDIDFVVIGMFFLGKFMDNGGAEEPSVKKG